LLEVIFESNKLVVLLAEGYILESILSYPIMTTSTTRMSTAKHYVWYMGMNVWSSNGVIIKLGPQTGLQSTLYPS